MYILRKDHHSNFSPSPHKINNFFMLREFSTFTLLTSFSCPLDFCICLYNVYIQICMFNVCVIQKKFFCLNFPWVPEFSCQVEEMYTYVLISKQVFLLDIPMHSLRYPKRIYFCVHLLTTFMKT